MGVSDAPYDSTLDSLGYGSAASFVLAVIAVAGVIWLLSRL